MSAPGTLWYGDNSFVLEEANLYGIYQSDGDMYWYIELFPTGEDDYIMLNALTLNNTYSPTKLEGFVYSKHNGESDLYEHSVKVSGDDCFLQSIELHFGNWNAVNQTLTVTGRGMIETEANDPSLTYEISAFLTFKAFYLFETTTQSAKAFVDRHLAKLTDEPNIKFEQVASGLKATISGNF